jgi:glutamate-1-semialdehyde 2,1-aminomutase
MQFQQSRRLQSRAHRLIPGGCHTYAKGDDQYPDLAPGFIERGQGSHVWDVDGNELIEYGMGLRSVTLGHAFEPVVAAAGRQMALGNNFTRPAPIELECAERLLALIDGAEMVKFTKDGSTATTAAVRLARAHTRRDMVAVCIDHPFFSYDDWSIGTTEVDAGIPAQVKALTVGFRYNDLDSARRLFAAHPGEIACVILEPARNDDPADGFLHRLRDLCHEHGAVFILDEMITGFRWHLRGAQAYYDIEPDLSTFGKGMANGFALSALVGKRELMERGGLRTDKERVFLLSTTHGAENHALAAAVATMDIYEREGVVERLDEQGRKLMSGIAGAIEQTGLGGYFELVGKPCNLAYATRDADGRPSQAFRALFLQETIRQGLLLPSLVVSFSHTDEDVRRTVDGVHAALRVYRQALDDGVERHLIGRPVKPVYRRYN